MILHDPTFLNFKGEPITGRVPPRVEVVGNNGVLTPKQRAGVAHAYKLFCDAKRVSLGDFLTQHRILEDGTRVDMTSINGVDSVRVTPPPLNGGVKYELLPAFWVNAPALGESLPATIDSASWKTAPIDKVNPPRLRDALRKAHPGNQNWYDSRPDSKVKGLVLSWWGLSKDRYGAHAQFPNTATAPSSDGTYNMLYCNGVKIGEMDHPVYGACITEIAGVQTVCVLTTFKTHFSGLPGGQENRYALTLDTARNDATSWAGQSVSMNLWHAPLPANASDFVFKLLTFTLVKNINVGDLGDTFDIGGDAYWITESHRFKATDWCRFNASGTQGVIPGSGFVELYPTVATATTFTKWIAYVLIDPRTGDLSSVLNEAGAGVTPNGAPSDLVAYYTAAYGVPDSLAVRNAWHDYYGDTFVSILVGNAVYGTTEYHFLYQSIDGVVHNYTSNPSFGTYSQFGLMTGDMRMKLLNFFNVRDRKYVQVLGTTVLVDDTLTIPTGFNETNVASTGFEGCATSFDLRLIVDRARGEVKVIADGADITAAFNAEVQTIQYPVLCGPLSRIDGAVRPQAHYVTGAP